MEETKAPDLDEPVYDVIIVGAGFAGLSAALYFKDCGINNILILEADDRIGGRVYTQYITIDNKQCQVDIGAAYSGPKQNRTLNMADRFGVKLYKAVDAGSPILNHSGNIIIMDSIMGIIKNFWNFIDINYGIQQINKLTEQIDKMDDNMLKKFDSITFQNWAESIMSHNKFAQDFLCSALEMATCTNPSQISLLTSLEEFSAAGSVEAEAISQTYKFHGGTYSIAIKMMEEINKNGTGDKIKLNHCVTSVDHDDEKRCTITCDNDKVFTSKYTMICTATNKYKSIQFKPSLSWERVSVTNQMIQGHVIRVYVFYKTAFWRENGLTGFSLTCGDEYHNTVKYPILGTIDDTKPDGTFPCIMGLIVADKAIELSTNYTKEERKDIILKQYAKTYNDERAISDCVGYIEYMWHDNKFVGGGYAAIPRMGVLTQSHYDKIKEPEGDKVYFACTELAEQWDSYIDGAIERGQREGNKIARLLAKDNDEVRVVEFKENEPEASNLGDVNEEPIPWIQRNLPNSKQIQNSILWSMVAIGVYLNFRKR